MLTGVSEEYITSIFRAENQPAKKKQRSSGGWGESCFECGIIQLVVYFSYTEVVEDLLRFLSRLLLKSFYF
jgi:hypothetical protein